MSVERSKTNTTATELTFGAAAKSLRQNGYDPCTMLEALLESLPGSGRLTMPSHLASEQSIAVRTLGASGAIVAALVLTPIADTALAQRVESVLTKRGLLSGPVRLGSDGVRLRVLRAELDGSTLSGSVLDDSVRLLCASGGYGQGLTGDFIPLDGCWESGTLLETPRDKLPGITAEEARTLLGELGRLPYQLARERAPRPRPSKSAWIGR